MRRCGRRGVCPAVGDACGGTTAGSAQPARGVDGVADARAGEGQSAYGVRGQRDCRRSGARDAACRRLGHRCGDRHPARAQHRRAAVERSRRRRVHSLLGQGEGRAEGLRRPRDGTSVGAAGSLSRQRQADAVQRRGAVGAKHRRARSRAPARRCTQAVRQTAVGQIVRAGHPRRRAWLRNIATAAFSPAPRRRGEFRAGGAPLLLHARRQRPAHGASSEEPGVRGDAACHCCGRRRCVLRGSDRAGDRRCGGSGADRARRHDAR